MREYCRLLPSAFAGLPKSITRVLRIYHQARSKTLIVEGIYIEHGINAAVETFFDDLPRRMAGRNW